MQDHCGGDSPGLLITVTERTFARATISYLGECLTCQPQSSVSESEDVLVLDCHVRLPEIVGVRDMGETAENALESSVYYS